MKIHLGCGKRYIAGWTHVDVQPGPHIDVVADARDLGSHFAAGSVDVIYACTLLEHFPRNETVGILRCWRDVLRPGGTLRLSVPDFSVLARIYLEGLPELDLPARDIRCVRGMIVGGQRDEWDYHKEIFDEVSLQASLVAAGYVNVRPWNWRVVEHSRVDDYSRAYLPRMDFANGVNTSLNIEADRPDR